MLNLFDYRIHKAIVASGSKYLLEVFVGIEEKKDEERKELTVVQVPKPTKTNSNPNSQVKDDHVNRILKYIYHNQDFLIIKKEITDSNVSDIYAQAFVMKCTNLLKDLDNIIIEELLNPTNCPQFYLDSIRFDNKPLAAACEQLLQ